MSNNKYQLITALMMLAVLGLMCLCAASAYDEARVEARTLRPAIGEQAAMKATHFCYPLLRWTVYDGDTLTRCDVDAGFNIILTNYSARVFGVDTPEKHTDAGKAVTKVVEQWTKQFTDLTAQSMGKGKYHGRFIARILGDGQFKSDLTSYLLANDLCHEYHGKKKTPWTDERLATVLANANKLLENK